MGSEWVQKVKIFVASSGELRKERKQLISIVNSVNKIFDHLYLAGIKCETDIPGGNYQKKRIQDEITPLLENSQIAIVLIYSKIGKFTLEEYNMAMERNKKVFLYFKQGFCPRNIEENKKFLHVLKFKKKIENENKLLFKEYTSTNKLELLIRDDLSLYLKNNFPASGGIYFAALSSGSFEHLVYSITKFRGDFKKVRYYHRIKDNGRDVVAYKKTNKGEERWYIYCGKYDRIDSDLLCGQLDKLSELVKEDQGFAPDRIVLATSCIVPTFVKDKVENHARILNLPKIEFWGPMELDKQLTLQTITQIKDSYITPAPVPVPHQIPSALGDFTGRRQEVKQLLNPLKQGKGKTRGVIIGGMGGVGKSSLAFYAANQLKDQYPDGQVMVDMRGTSENALTLEAAMGQVIHSFYPEKSLPEDANQMAVLYRNTLANRKVLILLDNAVNAADVRSMRPPSPCRLIVTSRVKMYMEGMTFLPVNTFNMKSACGFLQGIIGKKRITGDKLKDIVTLCGRLPLALRVAGNFLKVHEDWDADEYIKALKDERECLEKLACDDLDVGATLSVSIAQLKRTDASLISKWQTLSIFPTSFHRSAAAAVWKMDDGKAHDALSTLCKISMVLYDDQYKRYYFHDLMRVFARNCLEENQDSNEMRREAYVNAARWYEEESNTIKNALLPEAYDLKTGDKEVVDRKMPEEKKQPPSLQEALNWYEIERPNLMAAIEWAYSTKEWKLVQDISKNLVTFFNIRGYWADLEKSLKSVLEAARNAGDRYGEAMSLSLLGNVFRNQGRYDESIDMLETALSIFKEINNSFGESMASNLLANVYRIVGRWDEAFDMFTNVRNLSRKRNNLTGEAIALGGLGNIHRMRGEWSKALEVYEKAKEISVKTNNPYGESIDLNNIGLVYCKQNRLGEAAKILKESTKICKGLTNPRGLSIANRTMGEVLTRKGEYERAVELIEESLNKAYDLGDRRVQVQSLNSLGETYIQQQQWDKADQSFNMALGILERLKDSHGEGLTLRNIGILYQKQGQPAEAKEIWRKALTALHPDSPEYKSVKEWLN
jgi:tetratricopeptide (TPR) repeat protein